MKTGEKGTTHSFKFPVNLAMPDKTGIINDDFSLSPEPAFWRRSSLLFAVFVIPDQFCKKRQTLLFFTGRKNLKDAPNGLEFKPSGARRAHFEVFFRGNPP